MADDEETTKHDGSSQFERVEADRTSLVAELIAFLRATRKWWLIPVLAAILVLGLVVAVGGTAAAPFIYTLF